MISLIAPFDFSGFAGNRAPIIPDVWTMSIARNVVVPHMVRSTDFGAASNFTDCVVKKQIRDPIDWAWMLDPKRSL